MAGNTAMDDRWTKTIRLQVGADKQQWIIHPHYLRSGSDFFNSALRRHWRSGQEGVVRVEHIDPWLLHMIVRWSYGHRIWLAELQYGLEGLDILWDESTLEYIKQPGYDAMHPDEPNPALQEADNVFRWRKEEYMPEDDADDQGNGGIKRKNFEIDQIYINFVRLYALADELGATELMEHLGDVIDRGGDASCDLGARLPPLEALILMWQLLPDSDDTKQMWMIWAARCLTLASYKYAEDALPKDFRLAILRKMFELDIELA